MKCESETAFMYLTGMYQPDFRTINDFRKGYITDFFHRTVVPAKITNSYRTLIFKKLAGPLCNKTIPTHYGSGWVAMPCSFATFQNVFKRPVTLITSTY